jgi:ascorbate-specific PTS system EIIC-type component UlaA
MYEHVTQSADDFVWEKCLLSVGRNDEVKFLVGFDHVCYIGVMVGEMWNQTARVPSPGAPPWAMSSTVNAISLMVCYFVNWEYLVASPLLVDARIIHVSADVLQSNIPNVKNRLSTSRTFVLQVGCAIATHVVSIHTDDKDRRHHVFQTHRTLKFLHDFIVHILLYVYHMVHTCNKHTKVKKKKIKYTEEILFIWMLSTHSDVGNSKELLASNVATYLLTYLLTYSMKQSPS